MIIWLASYPRSGNTYLRVVLNSVFNLETLSLHDDRAVMKEGSAITNFVGHRFLPYDFSIADARASDDLFLVKTHDRPDMTDISEDNHVIYLLRDGRESTLSLHRYINDISRQNIALIGIILGDWLDAVVLVDDFQVPFDIGYAYDDYGKGAALTVDYIWNNARIPVQMYFPYTPSAEETGTKRGCVVLARDDATIVALDRIASLLQA